MESTALTDRVIRLMEHAKTVAITGNFGETNRIVKEAHDVLDGVSGFEKIGSDFECAVRGYMSLYDSIDECLLRFDDRNAVLPTELANYRYYFPVKR